MATALCSLVLLVSSGLAGAFTPTRSPNRVSARDAMQTRRSAFDSDGPLAGVATSLRIFSDNVQKGTDLKQAMVRCLCRVCLYSLTLSPGRQLAAPFPATHSSSPVCHNTTTLYTPHPRRMRWPEK